MTPITATNTLQTQYAAQSARKNSAVESRPESANGAQPQTAQATGNESQNRTAVIAQQNPQVSRVADELNRQLTASQARSVSEPPTQPSPSLKTDTSVAVATPGSTENLQAKADSQAQSNQAASRSQDAQANQQRTEAANRDTEARSQRAEQAQRPAEQQAAQTAQAGQQAVAQYQNNQSVLPSSTTNPVNRVATTA